MLINVTYTTLLSNPRNGGDTVAKGRERRDPVDVALLSLRRLSFQRTEGESQAAEDISDEPNDLLRPVCVKAEINTLIRKKSIKVSIFWGWEKKIISIFRLRGCEEVRLSWGFNEAESEIYI